MLRCINMLFKYQFILLEEKVKITEKDDQCAAESHGYLLAHIQ